MYLRDMPVLPCTSALPTTMQIYKQSLTNIVGSHLQNNNRMTGKRG